MGQNPKESPVKLQLLNSFQTPMPEKAKMKNYHLEILSKPNNPFMASVSFDQKILSPKGKERSKSTTKKVKNLD